MKHRKFILLVTILLLLINTSFALSIQISKKETQNLKNSGELIVYFIDIGQGDSILIQTPENKFILIDTGSRTYSSTLTSFLFEKQVRDIDAFIATHPHEDHIGGAQEVFDYFNILSVYEPGYPYSTQTYNRFITSAENEGCPIYTDEKLDPGEYLDISSSVNFQILNINKDASNANDASIVIKVEYQLTSFLFTGDINGDKEDYSEIYITDLFNVNIDILKVAHHGSRYSSTNYFLDEATPEISIISCGTGNSYGHPHQEALERLQEHNSIIYRTDENGNIAVRSDGYNYAVNYEYPENKPLDPAISGPSSGVTGYPYEYTVITIDPNNDAVFYKWDWCDGNVTDWEGPYNSNEEVSKYYSYGEDGVYIIKVKAKDILGYESDWSTFNVVMPRKKIFKNKILDFIFQLFK